MAGGRGSRMGGQDKGLLPWAGTTLAQHAARRLASVPMPVLISANRNIDAYHLQGLAAVPDRRDDFAGPLAALEAGLHRAHTPWLLCVPCDSPLFPPDLAQRLLDSVLTPPARTGYATPRASYARCGAQLHPVFCVLSTELAGTLTRFLDDGGRRMTDWWMAIGAATVDFGIDNASAFANANTPEQLEQLRLQAAGADPTSC